MSLDPDDIEVREEADRGVYIFRQDCEMQEIKDYILHNQEKAEQCSILYHQLKKADRHIKYLKSILHDPDKQNIHIKPEDYKKILEKSKKYDEVKDGTLGFIRAFNWLDQNKSIFEKERKLRERIERTKMHTETVLSDDSPNKEELQRVINLLDYLLQDEK